MLDTRTFYTNVANGTVGEAEVEKALDLIKKLDERNAKRREKPSKATLENVENRAKVVEVLKGADHPMTASEIASLTGFSIQKVGSLITGKNGVEGIVISKVKSASGKGKVNAYSLA